MHRKAKYPYEKQLMNDARAGELVMDTLVTLNTTDKKTTTV